MNLLVVAIFVHITPFWLIATATATEENEVWLDDEKPEYEVLEKLSRNVTRCTTTLLSLQRETFLHNWELNGFSQYLDHAKTFSQPFDLTADDVAFKSEHVDGKWSFRIARTTSGQNFLSDLQVSASYAYVAEHQNRITFAILFSVVFDQEEMVLPVQTSTNLPVHIQQLRRLNDKESRSIEYRLDFKWPSLSELENLTKSSGIGEHSDSVTKSNSVVLFRFIITAYFSYPAVISRTESCRERVVRDFVTKKTTGIPPFLKYTESMLNDERYFDLVIRAGHEEFLAHRIILAASSPVLSLLLFNESTLQPRNETSRLQMDADIYPEAVEEFLRYIYTGKVEKLGESAENLIILAYRFELPELKEMCAEFLVSKLLADNAMNWYHLGLQVNSSQLTLKSFDVIKANKMKLFPTAAEFRAFNEKHPTLMFTLFQST